MRKMQDSSPRNRMEKKSPVFVNSLTITWKSRGQKNRKRTGLKMRKNAFTVFFEEIKMG
jgi:hypothetical protein